MEQINLDTCYCDEGHVGLDGFVVSSGEPSVDFEFVDGVFSEVSCGIKKLVVRDRILTVGFGRDDSDACLLHDTFTYGVAVVSLVCDDGLGSLHALPEQCQCLSAIGSFATGDDVMQGVAEGIAEQVYLTAEAAFGAAQCLCVLTATGSGSMLMSTHNSRVDHDPLAVGEAFAQALQNAVPQALTNPTTEACVNTFPRPKEVRQVRPRTARAQNPEHRLDHQSIIFWRTTPDQTFCITSFEPVCVNFFRAAQTASVNTSLSCCMTITCNQKRNISQSLLIIKVDFEETT